MKINEFVLKIIIFFIVLTPFIRIDIIPDLRLEQIVVFIFSLILFMSFAINNRIKIKSNDFAKLILVFPIFILISIFYGYLKGVGFKINDFFEIYNIYIYLGIFLIFINLINSEHLKYKLFVFIRNCISLSSVISITQYFNIFNLNNQYIRLVAPTQYRTLVDNYSWPRVVGMTSNPNVYAIMVVIGLLISISLYLNSKKKKDLLHFLLNFIVLLMTLSRSGFVSFIIVMISYMLIDNYKFLISFLNLKIKKKYLLNFLFGFSFILILLLLLLIIPDDLTWRLYELVDLSGSSSWQARLINWQENFVLFVNNPFFGIGPAKSINYKHAADNEWLLLLRMYGFLGTFYFILMFTIPIFKFKRFLVSNLYGKTYISLLIGLSFYMIPAAIYSSFQVMPLVMVIAGLSFEKISKKYEIKF